MWRNTRATTSGKCDRPGKPKTATDSTALTFFAVFRQISPSKWEENPARGTTPIFVCSHSRRGPVPAFSGSSWAGCLEKARSTGAELDLRHSRAARCCGTPRNFEKLKPSQGISIEALPSLYELKPNHLNLRWRSVIRELICGLHGSFVAHPIKVVGLFLPLNSKQSKRPATRLLGSLSLCSSFSLFPSSWPCGSGSTTFSTESDDARRRT